MTNYSGCIGVGKVLYVGDTVTSSDGSYVLKLTSTGFSLSFNKGSPHAVLSGLFNVKSAKLTNVSIIIDLALGRPYVIPLSVVAVKLCVEDDGDVEAFDVAGDSDLIFSYDNAFVLVSASALAAMEASFRDLKTKIRELKRTVRPILLDDQGEKVGGGGGSQESGFPDAIDSSEKVA